MYFSIGNFSSVLTVCISLPVVCRFITFLVSLLLLLLQLLLVVEVVVVVVVILLVVLVGHSSVCVDLSTNKLVCI